MRRFGKKSRAAAALEALAQRLDGAGRHFAPAVKALSPVWAAGAMGWFAYGALSWPAGEEKTGALIWIGALSAALTSQALCIWKLGREADGLKERLGRQSSHDPLTGALSLARLTEETEREIRLAQRHGGELAMVAVRVENLMEINERFGREEGDKTLSALAQACQEELRDTDFFGRLNGLVFCALLPGASGRHDEAGVAMGRLREAAGDIHRSHELGEIHPVARLGLAVYEEGDTAGDLMSRAAEALDAIQAGGGRRASDRGEAPAR